MAKQKQGVRPIITALPDFGKVPPQAIDMEEAVLGAIINDRNCVYSVIDILKPESFYKESHQKIYDAIIELTKKNFPVDLFSVTEYLRSINELEMTGGPV